MNKLASTVRTLYMLILSYGSLASILDYAHDVHSIRYTCVESSLPYGLRIGI